MKEEEQNTKSGQRLRIPGFGRARHLFQLQVPEAGPSAVGCHADQLLGYGQGGPSMIVGGGVGGLCPVQNNRKISRRSGKPHPSSVGFTVSPTTGGSPVGNEVCNDETETSRLFSLVHGTAVACFLYRRCGDKCCRPSSHAILPGGTIHACQLLQATSSKGFSDF